MGPILGGTLADTLGYAATFKGVSLTIFLSAIIVLFGVKEVQAKVTNIEEKSSYTPKEVITHIIKQPVLLIVMLLSARSEEHTSELQSRGHLVCRLLLE